MMSRFEMWTRMNRLVYALSDEKFTECQPVFKEINETLSELYDKVEALERQEDDGK